MITCVFAVPTLFAENRVDKENLAANKPKAAKGQAAWDEALGQVKLLAARLHECRDKAVASKSLAGLASVVCQ